MITSETLKKIRRVELKTRRLVNDIFAGEYHSVFKGRGIVFDEVRPYEPGDDVRDIDWNVTARTGEPYVKRYIEDRELTVMIVMDVSASIMFGSVERQKREVAAELGAVLAFSAISNNDRVGLILFSDQIEVFLPPRKGRRHVLRLIREILAAAPKHTGTDISGTLKTVNRMLKRRAIIFLISDFLVDSTTYARDLAVLGRRHDLITITTYDPLERNFPSVGLVNLQDAETGEVFVVDTSMRHWQQTYRRLAQEHQQDLEQVLKRSLADRVELVVNEDYISALTAFFRKRSSRIR